MGSMTTTTLTVPALPFGKTLQVYRQVAGIDQTTMGARMGVARQTISTWERGEREPSFSQVVTWARLTGQPLEPLIEAVNAETAPAEAGAVSNVRHEGLEPPTFWSVVSLDVEYELLCTVEAVALAEGLGVTRQTAYERYSKRCAA